MCLAPLLFVERLTHLSVSDFGVVVVPPAMTQKQKKLLNVTSSRQGSKNGAYLLIAMPPIPQTISRRCAIIGSYSQQGWFNARVLGISL